METLMLLFGTLQISFFPTETVYIKKSEDFNPYQKFLSRTFGSYALLTVLVVRKETRASTGSVATL